MFLFKSVNALVLSLSVLIFCFVASRAVWTIWFCTEYTLLIPSFVSLMAVSATSGMFALIPALFTISFCIDITDFIVFSQVWMHCCCKSVIDWWYFGISRFIVAKLLLTFCSYIPKTSFVSRVLLMIESSYWVIYTIGNYW